MNRALLFLLPLLLLLSSCGGGISDQRPEPIRKSEYLLQNGVRAFEDSDYVEATDFLTKALSHYRSIDNTEGVLLSRINLAETAMAAGNFQAADEQILAAQKIIRSNAYPNLKPRLTLLQAQSAWQRKQDKQALQLVSPLLPAFDQDYRSSTKPNLITLAATILRTDIAFQHDTIQQQRIWLKRLSLMAPATEGNTTLHRARLLRFEAQTHYQDNQAGKALEKLQRSLELYREAATRPALAATLTESGKILMALERWEEAESELQRALYIRLWIMDRNGAAELMKLLQDTYLELGDKVRYQQMKHEAARIGQTK